MTSAWRRVASSGSCTTRIGAAGGAASGQGCSTPSCPSPSRGTWRGATRDGPLTAVRAGNSPPTAAACVWVTGPGTGTSRSSLSARDHRRVGRPTSVETSGRADGRAHQVPLGSSRCGVVPPGDGRPRPHLRCSARRRGSPARATGISARDRRRSSGHLAEARSRQVRQRRGQELVGGRSSGQVAPRHRHQGGRKIRTETRRQPRRRGRGAPSRHVRRRRAPGYPGAALKPGSLRDSLDPHRLPGARGT